MTRNSSNAVSTQAAERLRLRLRIRDSGVFLGRNLGELGIDSGYAKILYITQKFSQVYKNIV